MNLLNLAAMFLAAVGSSFAQAQTAEPILGIQLGKVFEPVKCEGRRDNWCSLEVPDKTRRSLTLMPPDSDSPTGLPTWVKREKLHLDLNVEGKVESFYVTTLGPSVQERVIESISGRFGKPTTLEKQTKQSSTGMTVETISAVWKTADAVVSHTCERTNACTVVFYTGEAYAAEVERWEQRRKRDKL